MAKLFIGLTDFDGYDFLRIKGYEELNFWRPGGTAFKALRPGELFLFKLKSPPIPPSRTDLFFYLQFNPVSNAIVFDDNLFTLEKD